MHDQIVPQAEKNFQQRPCPPAWNKPMRLGIVPPSAVFLVRNVCRQTAFMIRRCFGFSLQRVFRNFKSFRNIRKYHIFFCIIKEKTGFCPVRVSENNLQICNERHKKISYWHGLFQKCYFFLTFRDNFLSFKKNQHHLHHGVFFYVQNQNRHRRLRQSRPRR